MIKNYLRVTWRNLVKNKVFSFINITGLAIGLACFLLITLYVTDELAYDRYNEKAERIYRVDAAIKFGGNELNLAVSSDPMGATLKKDYPQVEEYTRIYASNGNKLIKRNNEFISEDEVAHADSTFFNVFTLPAISGDTKTALNAPNTVVITESTAKKYFDDVNAIGKVIETDEKEQYKVTAVIKDMPRNSHFNFDMIFSMKNVNYQWGNFLSHNFHTYIVLKKGADYREFEKNFSQFTAKYILAQAKQLMEISSMEEFEKSGNKLKYSLMPLTDIHLHSDLTGELGVNGNIQYVYIFSAIALFILLIACINFMNLSTARSANRAREVGIRKVLGTSRKELITQFLIESTVMAVISLILAVAVAYLILPTFNDIAGKSILLRDFFTGKAILFIILLPFIVGLLAGSYPAFFLSGFKPIQVLKGKLNMGSKSGGMRSGLVVFQFAISIFLIIGTIIIYKQINYIQHTKLGFNKDQVLIINGTDALGNNVDAFKNEVLQMPGVSSATMSGFLPVNSSRNDNSFSKDPVMDAKNALSMQTWRVDYDYIKTLGMEMQKGRNFSKDFGSDSTAVILNEAAARVLGYDDPVGKKIYTSTNPNDPAAQESFSIIGVVKNFHYESLRDNIGPLCFFLGISSGATSFKVTAANIPTLLKQVESKWKTMAPGMPFSHRFMDDAFNNIYHEEMRVGKLAMIFSLLAIFIACLGLFGLATFMAEQRTKEIGIRKVLGANVAGIVQLLSKDFLKLVIIAFCLSVPLAWWGMNKWLQDFAYRVDISWWVFALAGLTALVIALITVSLQAIRAALANPVKSLRTE
ncbi:MAG TPA: ABC transporter permease [Ferruginibacter sp.]|nr:ABC transporter permease [Ferruginibacter sp.]